ncbi:hypothetical protein EJB05_28526, partial [Eragrostis curvula]
MFIVSKVAYNQGMNTFVFVFYRQATACLLLLPIAFFCERKNAPPISFWMLSKLFVYALIGNTVSVNLNNASIKLTSATVASASFDSIPVVTCLALLLRMEVVKLRSSSGIAKVTGIGLCLAGVLVIGLYIGPGISPLNHHRVFPVHSETGARRVEWIKGTFLMVLANMLWSMWIVQQTAVLKEYPNKMLVTLSQCGFSAMQSFVVAVAAERDFSRWRLRIDIILLAIVYSVRLIFIVGGILLVGGLYCVLWGKSKECKIVPCSGMNMMDSVQHELQKKTFEVEKVGEEQKHEKSASMVEQV